MTSVKSRRFILAVIGMVAVAIWFGIREYRCKVRGAMLVRQVESIKRDAAMEIKVGGSKAEVGRFFEQHNIPFELLETGAYGSLRTEGCAPLGCGTDEAFISVQVMLDAAGKVAEAPRVVGLYRDCL